MEVEEIHTNYDQYSFDELMYLDSLTLDTIDVIATDLLEIEESAIHEICDVPLNDRVLEQLNFPRVSDLMQVTCEL